MITMIGDEDECVVGFLLLILDARNSTVIIVRTLFAEGFHFH